MGDSCQISETSATAVSTLHKAYLQPLGHVINADGLGFYVNEPGSYSLLTISHTVLIQGKFVRCFENFTCATLVSLIAGNAAHGYARITIQAPALSDSKPAVYVSNTSVSVDSEQYFVGAKLSRPSLTQVLVNINPDVNVLVSVSRVYLTVAVEIPASYVSATTGLLSSCGLANSVHKVQHLLQPYHATSAIYCSGVSEQSTLGSESSVSLLGPVTNLTMTATANGTLDVTRFMVAKECDVFIHFSDMSLRLQRESGFSLHLGGSAVYSNFSLPSQAHNVSVEWMVMQLAVSSQRQALFSFTNNQFLLVYLANNTVHVDVSAPGPTSNSSHSSYDTGVTLDLNQWNKLVLTYSQDTGALDFYHFNSSSWMERRDMTAVPSLFSSVGVVSVGSWQPPQDGLRHERVYPFQGQVENVLIWDEALEPNEVPDVWRMDPIFAKPALSRAWTFDEGQGLTTHDFVSATALLLPPPPLDTPRWLASDVDYLLTRHSDSSLDLVLASATTAAPTPDLCSDFITQASCATLSAASKQDLYALCRYTLETVPYPEASLSTILTFTALCHDSLSAPPLQQLLTCSSHQAWQSLPRCRLDCVFGAASSVTNATNQCQCAAGYYGEWCDAVCPGGSDTPCSLHGLCLNDGSCACQHNWAGSADCSACTAGYMGTDCSILTFTPLTSPTGRHMAVVTAISDIITFTGLQFSASGLRGVYTLYEDWSTSVLTQVQVLFVSCPYGSCTAGVAVTHDAVNITVLPSHQNAVPDVCVNGTKILLPDNTTLSSSLIVTMTSADSVVFDLGANIEVKVTVKGAFLETRIAADSSSCSSNTDGVLDVCQPLAQSVYGSLATQVLSDMLQQINTQFSVAADQVLFQLAGSKTSSSAAGYALSFNGTSAWSGAVTLSQSPLEEFTLTLHVKPASYGGTVIAFGANTTLALSNENPLSLHCGSQRLSTGLALTLGEWNQVILTVLPHQSQIHVFLYNTKTSVQHAVLSTTCRPTLVSCRFFLLLLLFNIQVNINSIAVFNLAISDREVNGFEHNEYSICCCCYCSCCCWCCFVKVDCCCYCSCCLVKVACCYR
jgi:hypothetical protein